MGPYPAWPDVAWRAEIGPHDDHERGASRAFAGQFRLFSKKAVALRATALWQGEPTARTRPVRRIRCCANCRRMPKLDRAAMSSKLHEKATPRLWSCPERRGAMVGDRLYTNLLPPLLPDMLVMGGGIIAWLRSSCTTKWWQNGSQSGHAGPIATCPSSPRSLGVMPGLNRGCQPYLGGEGKTGLGPTRPDGSDNLGAGHIRRQKGGPAMG